jgi:hypothetical protein
MAIGAQRNLIAHDFGGYSTTMTMEEIAQLAVGAFRFVEAIPGLLAPPAPAFSPITDASPTSG